MVVILPIGVFLDSCLMAVSNCLLLPPGFYVPTGIRDGITTAWYLNLMQCESLLLPVVGINL